MKGLSLLYLTGIEDTEFKLVDEPTYRWVVYGGWPPESTLAEFRVGRPEWSDRKIVEKFFQSTGSSPDNDRALSAIAVKINDKDMYFSSIKDFLSALKEHTIVINEVYEGAIY